MPRKNKNADYSHHTPFRIEDYQPRGSCLNVTNPPQGGSGVKTKPEEIVREFRVMGHGFRIESVKEPVSKLERAIRIFLLITVGWAIGYLHHFLATY
jgi:hypothetical protein